MKLSVVFHDAAKPERLNLTSNKEFLPQEQNEIHQEVRVLLREKGITGRRYTVELKKEI